MHNNKFFVLDKKKKKSENVKKKMEREIFELHVNLQYS